MNKEKMTYLCKLCPQVLSPEMLMKGLLEFSVVTHLSRTFIEIRNTLSNVFDCYQLNFKQMIVLFACLFLSQS